PDIELKRVDELVANHVIGVAEGPGQRQDDAPSKVLCHTAGAFRQLCRDHVRLLEIRVRGVQDERLPAGQRMVEQRFEPAIPPLGKASGDVDTLALFRVKIDVEMFGLQYLKIEGTVPRLLPAEVLSARRRAEHENQTTHSQSFGLPMKRFPDHNYLPSQTTLCQRPAVQTTRPRNLAAISDGWLQH